MKFRPAVVVAAVMAGWLLAACEKEDRATPVASTTPVKSPGNGTAAPTKKLTLTGDGAPAAVRIVVAPNRLDTPKQAAVELQRIVEKATGQKWPIGESVDEKNFTVIVGDHPLAETEGIKGSELPPEGFCILLQSNRLFLVGHDTKGDPWDQHWHRACQTGTLFAVVEFGRRFLGARWVSPGPDGETIPACAKLEIPAQLDIRDAPFFRSRRIAMDPTNREVARWMRFNRLGWSQVTSFGHNWYLTISPEVYGKEHPDWFALVNGVRQTHLANGSYGGQLCTSNPEVVRKMAECAVVGYKDCPEMFSIAENDGGNHCECPNCRALDVEDWHPGKPAFADRLATFANRVKEAIGEQAPGMMLGYYGYHQGELPPVKTRLLPGIAVGDVHNGYDVRYQNPQLRERHQRILKGWREKCPSVFLITYFHGMMWWSLPLFAPEAMADLIQTAAQYPSSQGVYVGMTYQQSAFGTQGNEYWLAAELMWNPKSKPEDLLNEYYRAAYGPAAGAIRQYFQLIKESHAREAAAQKIGEDEMWDDAWVIPTYEPIRKECDRLIQTALAQAPKNDPSLARRVQMAADGWEWTKIQTDYLIGLRDFKESADKEKARTMLEILKKRKAFCDAHAASNDYTISVPEIKETDAGRSMSVSTGEYEAIVSGQRKTLKAWLLPDKEEKDVSLDQLPWAQAAVSDSFVKTLDAEPYEAATRVRVLAGPKDLCVAFEVEEPLMNKLVRLVREPDGEVWKDDEVEIFLNPARERKKYYHLLVNADGVILDMIHAGAVEDKTWTFGGRVTAKHLAKGWEVKLAIPYQSLGLTTRPLPGDVWSVNFTRSRQTVSANLAWSPTFGGFLKPERFGDLIFVNEMGE